MPWVLMGTLCLAQIRSLIKNDNFHSWYKIIFASRYVAEQICFGYLTLIEYNVDFKFPTSC